MSLYCIKCVMIGFSVYFKIISITKKTVRLNQQSGTQ